MAVAGPSRTASGRTGRTQSSSSKAGTNGSTSAGVGPNRKLLKFRGHKHLRERLVLSVLSGRSVRVDGIREDQVEVGLKDYEISFLRLIEKITNGSTIEISYSGTTLLLHPGLLPGGSFEHKCPLSKSIGYFLEGIIPLAMFGKKALDLKLDGITGEEGEDMSVDMIRTVTLPHLHLFGVLDGLELQIKRRGAAPLGGGQVNFRSPVVKNVKTLNFVDPGKIKRIRGIAYSTRVSPQFANRMVEAARSVLNRYIPDIYLYTDVYKGDESGKSPGYGLTLLSLTTNASLHATETISVPPPSASTSSSQSRGPSHIIDESNGTHNQSHRFATPEDLAIHAARSLLEQISRGGCVDERHQWLTLLLMVLGNEDVGRVRMGRLTAHSIQVLRDLDAFFGVRFKISPIARGDKLRNPESMVDGEGTGAGDEGEDDDDEDEDEGDDRPEKDVLGVKIKLGGLENGEASDGKKKGKTIPEEYLVSCLGIGYGNINRNLA